MNIPDYYGILGVPRNATIAQITSAFRKLAMRYHPDRCREPNAKQLFISVRMAFEILVDPGKRSVYDALMAARPVTPVPSATAAESGPSTQSDEHEQHRRWANEARERAAAQSEMPYSVFVRKVLGVLADVAGGAAEGALLGILGVAAWLALALPLVCLMAGYATGWHALAFQVPIAVAWLAYLHRLDMALPASTHLFKFDSIKDLWDRRNLFVGVAGYLVLTAVSMVVLMSDLESRRVAETQRFDASISGLRWHIDAYLEAYPDANRLGGLGAPPAFGKVAIVDLDLRQWSDAFKLIPAEYVALRDSEVSHVIRVRKRDAPVGAYSGGAFAYVRCCDVEVVDYKKRAVVYRESLRGSQPPPPRRHRGSTYGSDPLQGWLVQHLPASSGRR